METEKIREKAGTEWVCIMDSQTKEIIDSRVSRLLPFCTYWSGINLDTVKFARTFGFKVIDNGDLPPIEDGNITVAGKDEKYILVNKGRSRENKRYIILHELSLYFLFFSRENLPFIHRKNLSSATSYEAEREVEYFALSLLLPDDIFWVQYNDIPPMMIGLKVARLARLFCVPEWCVEEKLGIDLRKTCNIV